MDKTLGSANIINSRNIELLLEEMKKAQIAEYTAIKDEELRELQKTSSREKESLRDDLNLANSSVAEIQARIAEADAQIGAIYSRMLDVVNKRNRRSRLAVAAIIYLAFVAFLSASFFGNVDDWRIKIGAFLTFVTLGSLFQFNKRVRYFVFEKMLLERHNRTLRKTASEFGIDPDEVAQRTT